MYFDTHYINDDINIGIFRQKSIDISMNSGFIQTLYYSSNDFSTLLNSNNIGNDLTSQTIDANLNYADIQGIFFEKKFDLNSKHSIKTKIKLYQAKNIQYLNVKGSNNNRFVMSFDYYYSQNNIISKNNNHNDNYSGLGYGVDLEYAYRDDNFYFCLNALNINTYIDWNSITKMHYDFDSQTIYMGDDGFNHIKAFGIGYYEYDIDYKQKIPIRYKAILEYKIDNSISVGDKLDVNNSIYNELYIKKNYNSSFDVKFGYIYELKNMILGISYKNLAVEISNGFNSSNRIIKAGFKVNF